MQNSENFQGVSVSVKGRRLIIFVLKKCTKTFLQQCRIHKFFKGYNTHGLPFSGRVSLFSFSENVLKLSPSNAEFTNVYGGIPNTL